MRKKVLKLEAALGYMARVSVQHLHVTYDHNQGHPLSHILVILVPHTQNAVIALDLHAAGSLS